MENKEQDKIPTSKVERASRVFRTSMKVGANYIKHTAQKAVNMDVDSDSLDAKNAEELFKLMSQLKGSALKDCANDEHGQWFIAKSLCAKICDGAK
jgi:hypothetical protein